MINTSLPSTPSIGGTLRSGNFLTGLAVGAAVTLIFSNETIQRSLFRGLARVTATAKSGVEEMKERFHDAEAEVQMEPTEDEDDTQ